MPELPEVETIRRTLKKHICGLTIEQICIFWMNAVCGWQEINFVDAVNGRRIESLERRGKYLLITLDENWSLIAHMRMTGKLIYYPENQEPTKHTHVVFKLSKGELHFVDTRKFGRIQAVPTKERLNIRSLACLGPEPIEEDFTPEILGERLKKKKINLKAVLLDQSVLAGLGNIYADESLFLAHLNPNRLANTLSHEEIERLHRAIQSVLKAGIAAQGTSFRDYRDANGEKGSFQESLHVYGRAFEPCSQCGQPLKKIRLAGRTTVYCEYCQH